MGGGVLLGPQRNAITVTGELDRLGLRGKIAAITAGWQERESEDNELQDAIGHRAVNLRLHERVEAVFQADPELFQAHRARQDRVRQLQELYRLRLHKALEAARELADFAAPSDLVEPEYAAAVEAVRTLDEHHLKRIRQIHSEFEARWHLHRRPALMRHRAEVAALIEDCEIVAIAGGHVGSLLTRIRLLDVPAHLPRRFVMAWSAGAMVCTDRVVLFHDRPPEGPGHAEVFDVGMGLIADVVALPHATRRLELQDRARMSLFARRFSPSVCVALDPRCRLGFGPRGLSANEDTYELAMDGALLPMASRQGGQP